MNPYTERRGEIDHIELLEKMYLKQREDIDELLEGINKIKKDIIETCNHTKPDGSSAINYSGQEVGSGRSLSICNICKRYDYSKNF